MCEKSYISSHAPNRPSPLKELTVGTRVTDIDSNPFLTYKLGPATGKSLAWALHKTADPVARILVRLETTLNDQRSQELGLELPCPFLMARETSEQWGMNAAIASAPGWAGRDCD